MWDVKPIHVQLHKRFVNFVNKNATNENEIIKICHNLTMQGSSSAVSNSVSHISFLYNISRHNVPTSKHSLLFDTTADDVVAVSACIKGSKSSHSGMRKRFVNNRLLLLFYFVLLTIYF